MAVLLLPEIDVTQFEGFRATLDLRREELGTGHTSGIPQLPPVSSPEDIVVGVPLRLHNDVVTLLLSRSNLYSGNFLNTNNVLFRINEGQAIPDIQSVALPPEIKIDYHSLLQATVGSSKVWRSRSAIKTDIDSVHGAVSFLARLEEAHLNPNADNAIEIRAEIARSLMTLFFFLLEPLRLRSMEERVVREEEDEDEENKWDDVGLDNMIRGGWAILSYVARKFHADSIAAQAVIFENPLDQLLHEEREEKNAREAVRKELLKGKNRTTFLVNINNDVINTIEGVHKELRLVCGRTDLLG